MSLVAHPFGHFEFRICIWCCFLQASAVEKIVQSDWSKSTIIGRLICGLIADSSKVIRHIYLEVWSNPKTIAQKIWSYSAGHFNFQPYPKFNPELFCNELFNFQYYCAKVYVLGLNSRQEKERKMVPYWPLHRLVTSQPCWNYANLHVSM